MATAAWLASSVSSSCVLLGERIQLGALQIEHADAAILDEHRDHELGPRVGNEVDVARILRDVGDEHRLLVQRRPADQPLAELHVLRLGPLAVAHRQLHLELLRVLVEQQDAERAVVDQPLGQAGDARQQRVEIENRRHLAADFGQRLERVDVLALGLEQPRVLDGHGDVRGELPQQRLVLRSERALDLVQQVQRADHLALAPHRHRELRQHVAQRALDSAAPGGCR